MNIISMFRTDTSAVISKVEKTIAKLHRRSINLDAKALRLNDIAANHRAEADRAFKIATKLEELVN